MERRNSSNITSYLRLYRLLFLIPKFTNVNSIIYNNPVVLCCTSVRDPSQFWTESTQFWTETGPQLRCLSSGLSWLSSGLRHVSVLDQDVSQFWTKTCLSSGLSWLSSKLSVLVLNWVVLVLDWAVSVLDQDMSQF